MRKTLLIASAFIGVIVGAGLASGQEIIQYFTSFGLIGTFGAIITTALFAYVGFALVWIGSKMKTISHKDVIYQISGKYVGIAIDYILIFTLFGVGVVMLAGAGSNLSQQFGLPFVVGTLLMALLVLISGMMNVDRVVSIIGSITPFLILFVIIVAAYSFFTFDGSLSALDNIAKEQTSTLPNWFIAGINYVSFNTAVGASMALVMGGAETDSKTAARGGLIGGLGLGIIIVLMHLAIFSKIEEVGNMEMPMLGIVDDISPILGLIMSIVIFAMIFNTALSMFYSFSARFVKVGTSNFKKFYLIVIAVGFAFSFVGFTELVAFFYPFIGYLGLVLIGVLIYAPFKVKKILAEKEQQNS